MITQELLNTFRDKYQNDKQAQTISAAMAKTELKDLAFVPGNAAKLRGSFEIELKTRGITAQKQSGRCWLFSCMNIMRELVSEACGLEEFELSGNYLAFYDKLEKANNFLEMVIKHADEEVTSRYMEHILYGVGDGGYWDMAVDLVKKYGVVPKYVMPETYQSEHTARFRALTNLLLRKDAAELRERLTAGEDVSARKDEMLWEIYRAQCEAFGEPPTSFDFEYRDKDKNYHCERGMTPKSFFDKYIGMALDEYVVVTDFPTLRQKYGKVYQFHYMGSMAEGNVKWLNLNASEVEALCLAQLRDGEPIWFGCDSDAFGHREEGVWDQDSMNYEGLMGVSLLDTKQHRLDYQASGACHAMILVGVGFDEDGKPTRWKIENSWGGDVGEKGYFVCSEKYFRDFVYEVVVQKKHLNEAQLAMLAQEPETVEPWETH